VAAGALATPPLSLLDALPAPSSPSRLRRRRLLVPVAEDVAVEVWLEGTTAGGTTGAVVAVVTGAAFGSSTGGFAAAGALSAPASPSSLA